MKPNQTKTDQELVEHDQKDWIPRRRRHSAATRLMANLNRWDPVIFGRVRDARTRSLLPVLLLLVCGTSATEAASLWKADSAKSIISDRRGRDVGDIITILIQESSSTTKDASTKTAKKSATDMSISSFLFSPQASGLLTQGGKLPALKYDTSKSFDGGGAVKNSEQITARIAVRVIDRLPNGNLIVEGRRMTTFADEMQEVILRGVVRSADISAANTVFSYNVADASIHFISKGAMTAEQKKGWFTKIVDKVSPF